MCLVEGVMGRVPQEASRTQLQNTNNFFDRMALSLCIFNRLALLPGLLNLGAARYGMTGAIEI